MKQKPVSEAKAKETIYRPNQIPLKDRVLSLIFSTLLLSYGTFGLFVDDLYIPGKHSKGVHLHGTPVWIMYVAFLCAVANMLSVLLDHYDKRDNEPNYKLFARVSHIAGWILFILAMMLDLFIFKEGDW